MEEGGLAHVAPAAGAPPQGGVSPEDTAAGSPPNRKRSRTDTSAQLNEVRAGLNRVPGAHRGDSLHLPSCPLILARPF